MVLGCLATAVAVAGCTVASSPTPTSVDASALGPGRWVTIWSGPLTQAGPHGKELMKWIRLRI